MIETPAQTAKRLAWYAPLQPRWGLFGRNLPDGVATVYCGLCGLSYGVQEDKATHLEREHGATVTVNGAHYEWRR